MAVSSTPPPSSLLDEGDLGILYEVSKNFDWSHIAPAIFGTLFERSLDPKRRSLIGAHYTSEEDILILIEPVLIRPLKQRWQAEKAPATFLKPLRLNAPKEEARNSQTGAASASTGPTLRNILGAWIDELDRLP